MRGFKIPSRVGHRVGCSICYPILFSERARELLVSYEEEQFKVRMCSWLGLFSPALAVSSFLTATWKKSWEGNWKKSGKAWGNFLEMGRRGLGTRQEEQSLVGWFSTSMEGSRWWKFVDNWPYWVVGNNRVYVVAQTYCIAADQQMASKSLPRSGKLMGAILAGREVAYKPFSSTLPFHRWRNWSHEWVKGLAQGHICS